MSSNIDNFMVSMGEETNHIGFLLTKEERDQMAEEHEKTVYHVAKKFINTPISYDELVNIAFVGYAKALFSYRTDKETKFATYAINCMKNEILYHLKKEKRIRKQNVSMSKTLATDKNGNALQLEEILLQSADKDAKGVEFNLLTLQRKDRIREIIESELSEKERYVISHRYELYGAKLKTQNQLAQEMNMSQANISKIEKSVLKKLSKCIDRKELNI